MGEKGLLLSCYTPATFNTLVVFQMFAPKLPPVPPSSVSSATDGICFLSIQKDLLHMMQIDPGLIKAIAKSFWKLYPTLCTFLPFLVVIEILSCVLSCIPPISLFRKVHRQTGCYEFWGCCPWVPSNSRGLVPKEGLESLFLN